ncbi:MAG: hypothetical protein HY911_14510 [Desulfobacterales bacterium]|nr:hypothetical protein [Desulfobacterales bacterium]
MIYFEALVLKPWFLVLAFGFWAIYGDRSALMKTNRDFNGWRRLVKKGIADWR